MKHYLPFITQVFNLDFMHIGWNIREIGNTLIDLMYEGGSSLLWQSDWLNVLHIGKRIIVYPAAWGDLTRLFRFSTRRPRHFGGWGRCVSISFLSCLAYAPRNIVIFHNGVVFDILSTRGCRTPGRQCLIGYRVMRAECHVFHFKCG
jgi:hypothetical protein